MVEVITKLYAELAQSYMAQPLITFLEAVCMHQVLVTEINVSLSQNKFFVIYLGR